MWTFGIGLTLLMLATGTESSYWRQVGKSATVGEAMVDLDGVTRTGSTVSVWLKWPHYHSYYQPRAASVLMRTTFYCGTHQFKIFQMIMSDKEGKMLLSLPDMPDRNMARPGTVFGRAFDMLCAAADKEE